MTVQAVNLAVYFWSRLILELASPFMVEIAGNVDMEFLVSGLTPPPRVGEILCIFCRCLNVGITQSDKIWTDDVDCVHPPLTFWKVESIGPLFITGDFHRRSGAAVSLSC